MAARRIPTYAEIASFRESLIKSKKTLEQDELEKLQSRLVNMEFACLRAISSLNDRSDQDLMDRARQRAQLEHLQFDPEKRKTRHLEATAG